ncbi:MAG: nucleotide sugar dehydrogenase, partial [Paludibacteraceae bacterium]|nr:nucleotide sugar dehydrogenase [Paludibacteraceae bacterium]
TEKIVAGSTEQTAQEIQQLYASVLDAPVHVATSIEVAELAKIVENAQRDINISFINEIALICDRLGIDTNEVIDMASTKWNFMPYKPGLVGGHCISVDPYYLLYKADQMGYHPQVILSGRNVNNSIAKFIADKTMKLMVTRGKNLKEANVLLLGVTFKENFEDVRNTKVVDIASELEDFGCCVDLYDPIADEKKFKLLYNRDLPHKIDKNKSYDAIIVCVAHDIFKTFDFTSYHEQGTVIFDVKGCVKRALVDARL